MITALIRGLWVTFKHLFKKPVTVFYPEEQRPVVERIRWRHKLHRWPNGLERCVGCSLCAANCPVGCIYVEAAENDPGDPTSAGERYAARYEINLLHCIYCGYCEEACPVDAIVLHEEHRLTDDSPEKFVWTKQSLLVPHPDPFIPTGGLRDIPEALLKLPMWQQNTAEDERQMSLP